MSVENNTAQVLAIMTFTRYFEADKTYSLYMLKVFSDKGVVEGMAITDKQFDKYLPEGKYECKRENIIFKVKDCELGTIHMVNGVAPRKVTGCIATARVFTETIEAIGHNYIMNAIEDASTIILEVRR